MAQHHIIFEFVICVVLFGSGCSSNENADSVELSSDKQIYYFTAPLTKKPLASWIEIQKGTYPQISPIPAKVNIGELVTLLIYFKDPSDKYDISIEDCWAYDNENYNRTKNKLNLLQNIKGTREWIKVNYPKGSNLTSILYSTFTAFKFPDTDKVYLTCNVKLCYYTCGKLRVT